MRAGPAGDLAEAAGQGQRIKHIVAHPRAERDVPAAPVIRQGRGKDRAAEVFGHVDSEHPRDAARNVDSAGKIAVELDAIEQNAAGDDRAAVGAVFRNDGVYQHGGPVGNHKLLEIPPQAQLNAEFKVAPVKTACGKQLRGKLVVPADGALHHLREEGDEQAVLQGVFLRGILPAVHVDHVPGCLKNEIGQAQRHNEIPPGQLVPDGGRQGGGREIPVFHEIQKPEAQHETRRADALFHAPHRRFRRLIRRGPRVLLFKQQSRQPRKPRNQHQPDRALCAARQIERHAYRQQQKPLRPLRHEIIQNHARRDEPHKGQGGKRHLSSACSR